MSSARDHCEKAIGLDYGSLPGMKETSPYRTAGPSSDFWNDETIFSKLRVLDKHLVPFAHRLKVRLEPYAMYDRVEDKVTLLLQQLKERQNKVVQVDILNQCIRLLSGTLGITLEENDQINVMDLRRKAERIPVFKNLGLDMIESLLTPTHPLGQINVISLERYHLFFAMMKHAQLLSMWEIVEICCTHILAFKWENADDNAKEFIVMQIESCFVLAECLAELLAVSKIESTGSTDIMRDYDPRALGLSHPRATEAMLKLKSLILTSIQRGERLKSVSA